MNAEIIEPEDLRRRKLKKTIFLISVIASIATIITIIIVLSISPKETTEDGGS